MLDLRLVLVLFLAFTSCGPTGDPQGSCEFGVQDGWVQEGCDSADLPADLLFACAGDSVLDLSDDEARQWGTTESITSCRDFSDGGGGDTGGGDTGGGGGDDTQACYDEGFGDCGYYAPAPSGNTACQDAYTEGYCDCEDAYDMYGYYYCE